MNFMTTDLPTLLTLSDTDLRGNPEYAMAVGLDWRKVPRFLDGSWPEAYPEMHLLGADPKADAWWFKRALKAKYVVFDVETEQLPDKSYSGRIIQVGMYPAGTARPAIWDCLVYPEFDFASMFRTMIAAVPVLAHNTPFDVARIYDNFGISVWDYLELHDSILLHHLLWAEFPHGLAFLASVYSNHGKAKHLGVGNYNYLVGDLVDTYLSFDAMLGELESDPATAALYYDELKILMPIIVQHCQDGWPVNQDFVEECLEWIPQQMLAAKQIGEAYAGYPLSLESGTQLRILLDGIEDVFAQAKKLTGVSVKKELTEKGELSLGKETVNALRAAFFPVEFNEVLDTELALARIEQGAHPLLEAKALWIQARILMSNYIKPLLIPLVDGEYKGELHVGDGAPQIDFIEYDRLAQLELDKYRESL